MDMKNFGMAVSAGSVFIAAFVCVTDARAQAFERTFSQLRDGYNEQLRKDNGDPIESCKTQGTTVLCKFNDAGFNKSVAGFKALNLANGHFTSKTRLLASLSGGKVASVSILGDRADPMNLFYFAGQVGSLMHYLGPKLSDDEVTKMLTSKLGIMRGDSDSTIGEAQVEITDTFAVKCNSQDSHVTTAIGCIFTPRF
jgi:hypothetical protein